MLRTEAGGNAPVRPPLVQCPGPAPCPPNSARGNSISAMARSRIARQGPAPASRTRVMLAACVLSAIGVCIALGGPVRANSGRPRQGGALPVSLAITSVSPAYAAAGQTVTVRGSVTNTSSAAITGLSVRLRSSSVSFSTRDALQQYADGNEPLADGYVPGAIRPLAVKLAPGATAGWMIKLPAREVGMTSFGVYPLAAEADSAAGVALAGGTSRTFLPYWPRRHGPFARPRRQDIAWIWPLIEAPQQGACPGLPDNSLAASLAPGGRLYSLLTAGEAQSAITKLTWVIDPALLAGVKAMTSPYLVGSDAACSGGRQLPASSAAVQWQARLRGATSGEPVFVTPYADVDVAALTRSSLDGDLVSAFTSGRSVASSILGRDFSLPRSDQSSQAAAEQLNGMAWPADGLANHTVLENLAVNKVTAVVLDSTMVPPPAGQPSGTSQSAVASTPDGVNGDMRVLLSDDTITRILRIASSPSESPAASFAVKQRFLAETAMIAVQAPPHGSGAMVIAPPRRWDPPAKLAQSLLAETVSAPWLKPVRLGHLAAGKSGLVHASLRAPAGSAGADLSERLLRKVRGLDRRVRLLESIRLHPDPQLDRAVASVESSAWRGHASGGSARILLDRLSAYITSQQKALTIIAPLPVTLGGLRGTIPVSISNRLGYAVRVRLRVTVPGNGSITSSQPPVLTILQRSVVGVKLKMKSARVGSTTVSLSLLTPGGRPLPGKPVTMTIRATHFGTLALVILAAALGVFMITSAGRAIRQGRSAPQHSDGAGSGGHGAERPAHGSEADSVVADHADQGTSDYAAAPRPNGAH
jgi:Family of unknown function (DUF6049)